MFLRLWVIIAVALLLVIELGAILLLRRRHAAALAAIGGLTGRPAFADCEIDPKAGLPVDGVDFK